MYESPTVKHVIFEVEYVQFCSVYLILFIKQD